MDELVGRKQELAFIEDMIDGARQSKSAGVVIEGQPGLGKTALLDYAEHRAGGFTVLRTGGIESEFDLSYGALSRLLSPIQHYIDGLDAAPASLLSEMLRPTRVLNEVRVLDRYGAGAAVLALIAAAVEFQPVAVLIDDVQWIDHPSCEALAFVGRRLNAEGVAMIFACRASQRPDSLSDVEGIILAGLDHEAVAALLERRDVRGLSDERLEWITSSTDGNPLAIEELPSLLDEATLNADSVLYEPLPLGPRLEQAFGQRAQGLPPACREALLIAAIVGDVNHRSLHGALTQLGRSADDLIAAESAGLISLGPDGVQFRHPLIRSAIAHTSSPADRRRCHLAVADALSASANPLDEARRAWHLAAAAPGIDEAAASLLERVAARSERLAAFASASHAYERSAQLSFDEAIRAHRYLCAAETAYQAGMTDRCQQLINQAEHERADDADRFRLTRVQNRILTARGQPAEAFRRLRSAANQAAEPHQAAQLLLDAIVAYAFSGHTAEMIRAAEQASELAPASDAVLTTIARLAKGCAYALQGDSTTAIPLLGDQQLLVRLAPSLPDALQYLTSIAFCDLLVEDFDAAHELLTAVVEAATTINATGALPFALTVRATANYLQGAWSAAIADASQSVALADDTGRNLDAAHAHMILALLAAHQPNAAECHTHARIALDAARLGGSHGIEVHALQALGVNALANNNPEGAIGPLEEAGALSERLNLREFSYWSWPLDLIDAYVRTGRPVEAEHPLELLAWHAQRTRRPTTIAAYHCARGLLAGPGKFEEEFEQALAAHQRATRPLELGRVHLYHGERLRRAKKRSVSRDHLRSALQIFHAIGAGSWAKRAITELEATGIALAETPNPARNLLTPQELQVALALTQGATTKAAATQLFLSQKTVEYHLTRIYRKLEITTRQELANELLGVSR